MAGLQHIDDSDPTESNRPGSCAVQAFLPRGPGTLRAQQQSAERGGGCEEHGCRNKEHDEHEDHGENGRKAHRALNRAAAMPTSILLLPSAAPPEFL